MSLTQNAGPVVTTPAGRLLGTRRGPATAFLGVPFAKPPVGKLRFGAPEKPEPWEGIRDATSYGPTPTRLPQAGPFFPETVIPGDDTLTVNVFTPDPDARGDARMPVMVWIHGGGYFTGFPNNTWYEGPAFTRAGIIVVTISYRLGFDGFGAIEGAPANRGVLDWLAALEWVRDTIECFGGDPGRVTIAGHSAGGGAVLTLLGMEGAQSLFRAAISLSGGIPEITAAEAAETGRRLARSAKVPPTRAGFATLPALKLAQLEIDQLIGGPLHPFRLLSSTAGTIAGRLPFGPVIDGELITRTAVESMAAGVGAGKPLLALTSDDEISVQISDGLPGAVDRLPLSLALRLVGLPESLHRHYAGVSTTKALGRISTQLNFHRLALMVAEARAGGPTWLTRFAWPSPVHGHALHGLEMPFFFDILAQPSTHHLVGVTPPQSLATELHGTAVALIRGDDLPWPRWTPDTGSIRVLDTASTTEPDAYREVRHLELVRRRHRR